MALPPLLLTQPWGSQGPEQGSQGRLSSPAGHLDHRCTFAGTALAWQRSALGPGTRHTITVRSLLHVDMCYVSSLMICALLLWKCQILGLAGMLVPHSEAWRRHTCLRSRPALHRAWLACICHPHPLPSLSWRGEQDLLSCLLGRAAPGMPAGPSLGQGPEQPHTLGCKGMVAGSPCPPCHGATAVRCHSAAPTWLVLGR